ncbi:MAG: hypothetical protein ACRDIU_08910, partial [Actinomycetota bacterium]
MSAGLLGVPRSCSVRVQISSILGPCSAEVCPVAAEMPVKQTLKGPTALDNLALLCVHHHMLKTHH